MENEEQHLSEGECGHRVEGRAEIGIGRLVAKAVGHPIEAKLRQPARLIKNFDIADVEPARVI